MEQSFHPVCVPVLCVIKFMFAIKAVNNNKNIENWSISLESSPLVSVKSQLLWVLQPVHSMLSTSIIVYTLFEVYGEQQ